METCGRRPLLIGTMATIGLSLAVNVAALHFQVYNVSLFKNKIKLPKPWFNKPRPVHRVKYIEYH